jgi:hypothetical protein
MAGPLSAIKCLIGKGGEDFRRMSGRFPGADDEDYFGAAL